MFTKSIRTLFAILILASFAAAQTRSITIRSCDELPSAIPGFDEILIPNQFACPLNLKVPVKSTPTVIRAVTTLPAGKRAIATDILPKIYSPNAGPALEISGAGVGNYTFIGIDFGVADGVVENFAVVRIGTGQETSLDQLPANNTFRGCLIHGNKTGGMKDGIVANGNGVYVFDSSIYDIHKVGQETHGLVMWGGTRATIHNSYIEAAGINVMFGGADAKIPNLVPSDIDIQRNLFYKPDTWNPRHPSYAGKHWSVKNLFELKNARRVVINGNEFSGSWVDSQIGFAAIFTPRNQENTNPWATVEDVSVTNNIFRNAAGGISVMGTDDINSSQNTKRVKIENNLFVNIGAAVYGSNGRFLQVGGASGVQNLTVNRNTALQTGLVMTLSGQPHPGFVYTNNITAPGVDSYGIFGDAVGEGSRGLSRYAPDGVVTGNVLTGRPAQLYSGHLGNFFPPSLDAVGFVDLAAGNYAIAAGGPFHGKGADIAAINLAISAGGTVQPPPPPPPTPPPTPPPAPVVPLETTSVPVIGMESATVAFTLSGPARARVEYGLEGTWTNTSAVQASALNHLVILPNLRSNRKYNYRVVIIDSAGAEVKSKAFTFTTCKSCR